ncbi:MAG: hypothetical protein QGH60_21025 [Phycisphaerae bacterium]|jgi:hypothetical protein|nr:hypothetical protein [Phycisphaerae bacterium]
MWYTGASVFQDMSRGLGEGCCVPIYRRVFCVLTVRGGRAPAVGKWVAQQLMNLGISANHIEFFGHSHGTYVSFYAAQEIQQSGYGTVHGLVALDPANHNELLDGVGEGTEHSISFSDVAQNSLAIQATVDNNNSIPELSNILEHITRCAIHQSRS